MNARDTVDIGLNRFARRGYDLDEVSIVPSRRTRDVDDVSTAWQIDAFRFGIPLVTSPSDAVVSPATAIAVGRAGGLGVLNGEGLWTRYDDPAPVYRRIAEAAAAGAPPVALLQEVYAEPVKTDLITARIKEIGEAGATTAIRISPQHTEQLAPAALAAGVDLLVIQGTIVSAEHVTSQGGALNLKEFIADLDVPVIVGGAANYTTALHLMRTGAAGVIVGVGADTYSTTDAVMGIRVPLATAIADAAAARRDYLDETGGRYVHVIANGRIETSGAIARALACGADAVQLGEPLRIAAEAPAGGVWWDSVAAHPRLPRGATSAPVEPAGSLEDVLLGAAESADGRTNLFGALARTMAKTGYSDLKEFQRVDLVVGG
ncbi:GuaB3 family IMP dehydrogenase-related protein [Blastococcus sp. MG754426]|uniref:GuaB3 family IMP dehydrogenase-related protein n=1 Tax=unclassified Blastococcus TaxID=2619396 RepID=UPI001EEF8BC1|nr:MULTISPECIES: GuaB3 family IMP dehydrogenase-related protein [unclassified Blastococcus]MCF6507070.1 GuaB3 family IMP dehydrogenase-related protein [Blastococcus sp. MG754426]MCF6511802.1 GuaB3 family IMP dehydrogenase-related protein [Blastococcus sp. MG754427]MCF6734732.1 GuaB3 family IMP dehydrogenase-related protein [Blastococcus sp. KM273129]